MKREAVATPSLSERDVARINWPYDVTGVMTSYVSYYDILHKNEPATCHNNKPQSLIYDENVKTDACHYVHADSHVG